MTMDSTEVPQFFDYCRTPGQEKADLWTCDQCGREFVDSESLELHLSLHEEKGQQITEAEIVLRRELLYKEVTKQEEESGRQPLPENKVPYKPRRIYRPNSKRVGLTKIRLEDCLRCDACSCIYIDEQDYYKHMRNFHQKYNTVIPRARRKNDHKCVVTYTEVQPRNKSVEMTISTMQKSYEPPDTCFKEIIKNRWSKVSERLSSHNQIKIKQEPLDDMEYLLSQVEVKIKTEPPDF